MVNPAKQELLLELCKAFHPYLMKYLVMICQGHVPLHLHCINQDIVKFIRYFMPKKTPLNKRTVQIAVRHLHLAFKGMESGEIYDVLMGQWIRAMAQYDPQYTEKVKLVVEAMDEKLSAGEPLGIADVNRHVDFDCHRYLRLLCRRGHLTPANNSLERPKPAAA